MSAYITIIGNLGTDPEARTTPNGHDNISFSVAVNNRRGQEESTDWFRVTAWSGTAKGLTTLTERGILKKGAKVVVIGQLTSREYQDRNGTTRTSLDVNAQAVELASAPPQQDNAQDIPF